MTDPEFDALQMRRLTQVRTAHHHRLVESGAARRILDAASPVNYMVNTSEFGEGTLLFPSRATIGGTAIGMLWGSGGSLAPSIASSAEALQMIEDGVGDIIYLRRLEALHGGYEVSGATTGVLRDMKNPLRQATPLDGIRTEDHQTVIEILAEVEEIYQSGKLPCLDPETLVNTTLARPGLYPMP